MDDFEEHFPGNKNTDYIADKMQHPLRLMYWGDLEMANLLAKKRGYNRQLDTKLLKKMVKDMIKKSGYKIEINEMRFPATALMVHSHKGGKECMPHMRISVNMGEMSVMIDCDMALWESFTTLESIEDI